MQLMSTGCLSTQCHPFPIQHLGGWKLPAPQGSAVVPRPRKARPAGEIPQEQSGEQPEQPKTTPPTRTVWHRKGNRGRCSPNLHLRSMQDGRTRGKWCRTRGVPLTCAAAAVPRAASADAGAGGSLAADGNDRLKPGSTGSGRTCPGDLCSLGTPPGTMGTVLEGRG